MVCAVSVALIACALAGERGDAMTPPDPAVIASRLGIEVLAVPAQNLAFCDGQYARVGGVPRIYVDMMTPLEELPDLIAHELAHALVDTWSLPVVDEEAFASAFVVALSRPLESRDSSRRLKKALFVEVEPDAESLRPANLRKIAG